MARLIDLLADVPVPSPSREIDWHFGLLGRRPDVGVGDVTLRKVPDHAWLFIPPNADNAGTGWITFPERPG